MATGGGRLSELRLLRALSWLSPSLLAADLLPLSWPVSDGFRPLSGPLKEGFRPLSGADTDGFLPLSGPALPTTHVQARKSQGPVAVKKRTLTSSIYRHPD